MRNYVVLLGSPTNDLSTAELLLHGSLRPQLFASFMDAQVQAHQARPSDGEGAVGY